MDTVLNDPGCHPIRTLLISHVALAPGQSRAGTGGTAMTATSLILKEIEQQHRRPTEHLDACAPQQPNMSHPPCPLDISTLQLLTIIQALNTSMRH
uniref:Uncharacterized protein n=1 Tax=Anguilla anguilla TaxID=7936 RepID=A0A0E9PSD1_ANGAN